MIENRKKPDEAEDVTTYFNRGRRFIAEILRDNEHLRSKIRRLEDARRGKTEAGRRDGSSNGDADER